MYCFLVNQYKFPTTNSGAPAAQRSTIAIGREPHACIEIETRALLFYDQNFMIKMASGMDDRYVLPVMSCNMLAIFQLIGQLANMASSMDHGCVRPTSCNMLSY